MIIDFISVNRDTHLTENHNGITNDASLFGILIVDANHEIVFIDEKAKAILSVGFEAVGQFRNIQFLWKSGITNNRKRH